MLNFEGGWGCGIAWDPCNKYLICQTDNNSLVVWENTQQFGWHCRFTGNQTVSSDISEPVVKSSFFYRKVDFSPTGTSIVSTNMTLEGKPVSKLTTRDSFEHMLWFKGHLGNVYCARFHPKTIMTKSSKTSTTLLAIADSNGSLSIWAPKMRPIIIEEFL